MNILNRALAFSSALGLVLLLSVGLALSALTPPLEALLEFVLGGLALWLLLGLRPPIQTPTRQVPESSVPPSQPPNEEGNIRAAELEALMQAVPAIIMIAHDPACLTITGNQFAYDLLDIPLERNLSLSAPESERPRHYQPFQNGHPVSPENLPVQQAAAGMVVRNAEIELRFDDGRVLSLLGNAVPVRDQAGQITGALSVFIDISRYKNTADALAKSKEYYHTILSTALDGFLLVDLEGRILEVNDAYCALSGYGRDELLRMAIADLQAEFSPEKTAARIQRTILERGGRFETRHRAKDGHEFEIEVSASYIESEQRLCIFVRDVTERNRTQRAAAEMEQRYHTIFDNAGDAVIIHDLEGRILEVNRVACERFGYSHQELVGMRVADLNTPEQAPHVAGRIQAIRERGQGLVETQTLTRDGRVIPSEVNSRLIEFQGASALLSVVRDVSERKQAQEALRVSEDRYRLVFQEMLDGFALHEIICDDDGRPIDYRFLDINPSFERLTGLEREEVRGRTALEVLPRLEPVWIQTYGHVALSGEPAHFEQHTGALGRTYEISAFRTGPGKFATIFADITVRMEREREMQAVARLNEGLRARTEHSDIVPFLLEQVMALLSAQAAAFTPRESGAEFTVEAARGGWASALGRKMPEFRSARFEQLIAGEPFLDNDVRLTPEMPASVHAHSRAVLGLPLLAQGRAFGVVWVGRDEPWRENDVQLVRTLAAIAANALERAQLNQQTRETLENLSALHSIDTTIASSLDLRLTLNVLLDHALTQLRVDAADILLLRPPTQTLEYAAGRGFRSHAGERVRLRLGQSYAGRAALERRMIRVPNLREAAQTGRPSLFVEEEFVSYYAVPLIAKGHIKGVLEAWFRRPLETTATWLDFLETLATQAASAIDNIELFESLQRSNVELALAYDTTIEGWSRALDLRDKETEGHTQRVTEVTLQLARVMGIADAELVHMRRGALLHDIGKMGVPDRILLKPGPLTEEEWVIMRRHPQDAYDLLAPIAYLRPTIDIPYCHHERWDGQGYPQGLRGQEIPLAARIFAAVDIWDALRSDRPYRPAWPEARVLSYLREQAGHHLDPQVTDTFLRLPRKGLADSA